MSLSDSFYNDLIPDIMEVLSAYGTIYTVNSPSTYNASTQTNTPGSSREVMGLVSEGDSLGSSTWEGKKVCLLEPSANIQQNESVVIDGVTYPASKIEAIKPAAIVVLYIVDLST